MTLALLTVTSLALFSPNALFRPTHSARAVAPRMEFGFGFRADAMLRDMIERRQETQLGYPDVIFGDGLEAAHVLIFNPGQQNEGVYTMQGTEDGKTYVLGFELSDDADRFAQLLHADGLDLAVPSRWGFEQFHAFCTESQFEVSLVPEGSFIAPPSKFDPTFERPQPRGEQRDARDIEHQIEEETFTQERQSLERLFRSEEPSFEPPFDAPFEPPFEPTFEPTIEPPPFAQPYEPRFERPMPTGYRPMEPQFQPPARQPHMAGPPDFGTPAPAPGVWGAQMAKVRNAQRAQDMGFGI